MSDRRYEVAIAATAVASIRCYAGASKDGRETGGILLGHDPGPDGLVAVGEAGGPGPGADRRSDFFLRDLEHAREFGRAAWERERLQWVGEWHTHPGGGGQPSERDLSTYQRILARADLGFAAFVAVVVTPHQRRGWEDPVLAVWVLGSDGQPRSR